MTKGICRRRRRRGRAIRNGDRRDVPRRRRHVEIARAAALRAAVGRRRRQHRQRSGADARRRQQAAKRTDTGEKEIAICFLYKRQMEELNPLLQLFDGEWELSEVELKNEIFYPVAVTSRPQWVCFP